MADQEALRIRSSGSRGGSGTRAPAATSEEREKAGTRRGGGGGVIDAAASFAEIVAAVALTAMLAWAPLPYGSYRNWAWSLLAVIVGGILVVTGLARAGGRGRPAPSPIVVPVALFTVVAWLWAWLQTLPPGQLPFPAPWLEPHPFWAEAQRYGLDVTPVAAASAEAARDNLMRALAYGGTFWAALLLMRSRSWARWFLVAVVTIITVYAVYGLVNELAGWDTVLWEGETKAYSGYVTSTFVNRNSFATYANIGLVTAIGLFVEPFLAARGAGDAKRIAGEALQQLLGRQGPLLLAIVLLTSAMLLSGSRGGFLSLTIALVAFALLAFAATRPRLGVMLAVLVAAALVAWAVVAVSGDVMLARLSEIEGTGEGRVQIWSDVLQMIWARPELGHGYGSFAHVFPIYQNLSAGPLLVDLAHDTYLEQAAELGVPATILLDLGPALLFLYCVRGVFVRRRDQVFPLVTAAVVVLVAVHSLVDFSLQMPAVAVTFAAILGVGVAQSAPSARPRHGASLRE